MDGTVMEIPLIRVKAFDTFGPSKHAHQNKNNCMRISST